MAGAVAKQEADAFEPRMAPSSRSEVLARYRHLRKISNGHHDELEDFLSADAVLRHARRLGIAIGRTLLLDDPHEMNYALDLAIYTAPPGRTRAVDRYARAARFAPESDEALLLGAMCNARFAVVRLERRHPVAGVVVADLFRGTELWLVDEGMELTFSEGNMLATRLFTPDSFSMTAAVGVPFNGGLLEDILDEVPQLGRRRADELADDRRFAEAVYRIALQSGLTEKIVYLDPLRAAG
jgi:hypothetical protein